MSWWSTAGTSAATAAGSTVITAETGAIVSLASTFGYVAVGNITSVSPASGQLSTKVTIAGSDLLGGGTELTGVTLAGIAVQSITSDSSTEVIVVAAASNSAATGDIVLSSENGASVTSTNGFEYLAPTAITSVLPVEGQSGTSVTIQGTRLFSGGASVSVTLQQCGGTGCVAKRHVHRCHCRDHGDGWSWRCSSDGQHWRCCDWHQPVHLVWLKVTSLR